MKKLLVFVSVTLLTAFVLTGCLDSQEDVNIKSDGSGVYKNSVDMSGLFDMLQMAAMMDTSANSQLKQLSDKNIDSTFSLGAFTDTSSSLSAEDKALLKDGTVHLAVNQQNKVLKIDMTYPFKKVEDLQKILELQKSGKGFNPLTHGGQAPSLPGLGSDAGGEMGSPLEGIAITYKNGLIERKVDPAKLDAAKNSEAGSQLKNMGEALDGVTFSTVIHLPRPVKSSSGKVSVSDDKKTVRMKYTLSDMMKDPKALEFKLEY
ncbi:MAG TPA: hypothetical protein VI385_04645 [Flavisolibacter sp.]